MQGTAEFHHQIADALLPQADPVFHHATALDATVDMLDPQPTVVQSLIGQLQCNWLQVLDTAECSQVDQRVCQQLHPIVSLLDACKTEQESLERIFPGKGALHAHPQRMDGGVEEAFAAALWGLAVARILFDIGDQAGIENTFPIVRGIKATIKIEISTSEVQPDLFRHLLQRLQALWQQHHVGLIHGSHWDRS